MTIDHGEPKKSRHFTLTDTAYSHLKDIAHEARRTEAARSTSIDRQAIYDIERVIDRMIRQGTISDDNIRAAVNEISDFYNRKRVGNGDN